MSNDWNSQTTLSEADLRRKSHSIFRTSSLNACLSRHQTAGWDCARPAVGSFWGEIQWIGGLFEENQGKIENKGKFHEQEEQRNLFGIQWKIVKIRKIDFETKLSKLFYLVLPGFD